MTDSDDGLIAPPVGAWAELKYKLVHTYATIFATSMKNKWDARVYIDLFSGAGKAQIAGTSRVVKTSPLLALEIPDRFDKYIFCEKDREKYDALVTRIQSYTPSVDFTAIYGNANESFNEIISAVPNRGSVLCFCFVDPYKTQNLFFRTISNISTLKVDFLILLPIYMDINRNINIYLSNDNNTIDNFVDTASWREEWIIARDNNFRFDDFFSRYYFIRMQTLGYNHVKYTNTIRSIPKNLPLYKLGFFSRHKLGKHLWDETEKFSNPQIDLFSS